MNVSARFVGQPQKSVTNVETVGDLRTSMGADDKTSIMLTAGNGQALNDSDALVDNQFYTIQSKTAGSVKSKVIFESKDGSIKLVKTGKVFNLNGTEMARKDLKKFFEAIGEEVFGYAF